MLTARITSESLPIGNVTLYNNLFSIKFRGNKYLITCHYNIPIKEINIEGIEDLNNYSAYSDIYIDCIWNDVLILNPIIEDKYIDSFEKFKIDLVPVNTLVFFDSNNENFAVIEGIIFRNIKNNPLIAYYKINSKTRLNIGQSVYIILNNKPTLVGMVSNLNLKGGEYEILVLPSYYIIKTLLRKNSNDIYYPKLDLNMKISSIDGNEVDNSQMIYHDKLKYRIPVNSYFLLEIDGKKSYLINYNIQITDFIKKCKFNFKNDDKLIINYKKSTFDLTIRLMQVINLLNDKLLMNLYSKIKLEENKGSLKIQFESDGKLVVFI